MHVNTLPGLIHVSIFNAFCKEYETSCDTYHCVDKWKNNLPILAVCQKWRILALPIVHKNSFIACNYIKGIIGNASPDSEAARSKITVDSNLDIIAKNESSCFPRQLMVCLMCPDIPVNTLSTFIEHIRPNSVILQRVQHIEMGFFLEPYGRLIWRAVPIGDKEARLLGKELAELLPGVTQFTWLPPHNNEIPQAFSNEALKCYSQKLTKLVTSDRALLDIHCLSKQLKHLLLAFVPKQPKTIPHICSEGLETLHLDEVDGQFPWISFADTPDSETLNFANLQRATLGCAVTETEDENGDDVWDAPADSFPFKISAPKLRYIRIQLCPYLLSLVSSIHDLDVIGELEIETRGSSINLTNFRLDMSRKMFSDYAQASLNSYEMIDWYRYLNDILSTPGIAKTYKASIGLYDEFIEIERVQWSCLTSLKICCPMSYPDLQRLVARLPKLSELSVSNVMVSQENET